MDKCHSENSLRSHLLAVCFTTEKIHSSIFESLYDLPLSVFKTLIELIYVM